MLRIKNNTEFEIPLGGVVVLAPNGGEGVIERDAMWITERPLYQDYKKSGAITEVKAQAKTPVPAKKTAPAKKGITQVPKGTQKQSDKSELTAETGATKDGDT